MSFFELVEKDKDLSRLNTWRVGGQAKYYACPETPEQLATLLTNKPEAMPLIWLGLGSNVLFCGQSTHALVIHTKKLNRLEFVDGTIKAQCGVPCAKVAKLACKHDCLNAEFFSGIPGTVGGALAMNAGAFGGQTWEWVKQVTTVDLTGQFHHRGLDDFEVGYRHVLPKHPNEFFVEGVFELPIQDGGGDITFNKIKELLRARNQSQPIGTHNCGSVFKNPDGGFAAQLIEQAGLKGLQVGGAKISEKHANFIINVEKASCEDILTLMDTISETVNKEFGVALEPEVKIIR